MGEIPTKKREESTTTLYTDDDKHNMTATRQTQAKVR